MGQEEEGEEGIVAEVAVGFGNQREAVVGTCQSGGEEEEAVLGSLDRYAAGEQQPGGEFATSLDSVGEEEEHRLAAVRSPSREKQATSWGREK